MPCGPSAELLLCYPAASQVPSPLCTPHWQEMLSCHPGAVLDELGRATLDLAHLTGERTAHNDLSGNKSHFPTVGRMGELAWQLPDAPFRLCPEGPEIWVDIAMPR